MRAINEPVFTHFAATVIFFATFFPIYYSLYGYLDYLQPYLRKKRISREKLDFVLAFNEMLCNLTNSKDLLRVQDIADETVAEETESDEPHVRRNFDEVVRDTLFGP